MDTAKSNRKALVSKLLNARVEGFKVKDCVYCEGKTHKSPECTKVVTPGETRNIEEKAIRYNCTSPAHRTSKCQSRSKCKHCDQRHHTSICDRKEADSKEKRKTLLISGHFCSSSGRMDISVCPMDE